MRSTSDATHDATLGEGIGMNFERNSALKLATNEAHSRTYGDVSTTATGGGEGGGAGAAGMDGDTPPSPSSSPSTAGIF